MNACESVWILSLIHISTFLCVSRNSILGVWIMSCCRTWAIMRLSLIHIFQLYVAGLAAELPDGAAAALREQDRPLRFKSCFRHLRERLLCGQNVG